MDITDQSYGIIPLRDQGGIWFVCLICHLSGHWAFPKGHPEAGESAKQAAQRELLEESGLTLKAYLSEEYLEETYSFRANGNLINKAVGYFIAEVEGEVQLQIDEVVDFKWVPLVSAFAHLNFPEARRICRKTYQLLSESGSAKK
jgi:bis(5'-nucleosidyl)-tetraphosphatase